MGGFFYDIVLVLCASHPGSGGRYMRRCVKNRTCKLHALVFAELAFFTHRSAWLSETSMPSRRTLSWEPKREKLTFWLRSRASCRYFSRDACTSRHWWSEPCASGERLCCKGMGSSTNVISVYFGHHGNIYSTSLPFTSNTTEIYIQRHFRLLRTPRKYVFSVTSVGQHSSLWSCNSIKIEIKFHIECKLRFLSAQFRL